MFLDNSSFKFIREAIAGNIEGIRNLFNEAESLNITHRVIDFQDGMGRCALFWSIQKSNIQAATFLIDLGVDVNPSTNDSKTPLIIAIQKGHSQLAEHLIERGADVNASTDDGNTPLIEASAGGHISIIKKLIKHGARIDDKDKDGRTSLIVSIRNYHPKVFQYLFEQGANTSIKDNDGKSAIDWIYGNMPKSQMNISDILSAGRLFLKCNNR